MTLYSDFMIREALREPLKFSPMPGFIFSSQVDNLAIIHWALRNNRTHTNPHGQHETVRDYTAKLYEANVKYIDALNRALPPSSEIDHIITDRINVVTSHNTTESFYSIYGQDIILIGLEVSAILIGSVLQHIYGEHDS